MKILFFGDIYGKPGRRIVANNLEAYKLQYEPDLIIANCENIAGGRGVTRRTAEELFNAGIDLFTSGNHLWDRREGLEFIKKDYRISKPINYPKDSYGQNYIERVINGKKIVVISLCGLGFMNTPISPFLIIEDFLKSIQYDYLLIDFHAESTAEKHTLLHMLDGKATAVLGTHTHVQTADEKISDAGTAYITDVGMCGGMDSVIGVDKEAILKKVRSGMPERFKSSYEDFGINAVYLEFSENKADKIIRINDKVEL